MKVKILTTMILSFSLFVIFVSAVRAQDTQKELDLSLNAKYLNFNTQNLKPGDAITKQITVQNKGKSDFYYITTLNFIGGSNELFNKINLSIQTNNKILFKGLLKDFEQIEPRKLISSAEENLDYTIEIPYELDNRFQGLASEIEFKFYVEGTLGGVLPVDNKLPTTGSEMFNLLATGAALLLAGLILFAYVKRKKLDTKRP